MKYEEMPFKEWDGKEVLYCDKHDKYFMNLDEIVDFIDEFENEETAGLQLIICTPNYLSEIDFTNEWCDIIPDGFDSIDDVATGEFIKAMQAFNALVRQQPCVSYSPGKFRTDYAK